MAWESQMQLEQITELHYITHIGNVPSIVARGILSQRQAKKLGPASIANPEIQERRARKRVPGGLRLDEYANLYVCARNPMLYSLQNQREEICVLRVDKQVALQDGVVISDRNAARDFARFSPAPEGFSIVDKELAFAEYWLNADPIREYEMKGAKCAEVLVPHRVDPKFVTGAYVACAEAERNLTRYCKTIPVTLNPHLFFL
jgi:hypothetical protein